MNSIPVLTADDIVSWAAGKLNVAGVENARFEAQLLLGLALGVSRTTVVARTYSEPGEAQRERFAHLVEQRGRRVPLAYLRGTQEFYGRSFVVTSDVLIPRPETELLVEKIGETLVGEMSQRDALFLADVGTGSGCIPVSILAEHARVRGVAVDISASALKVARRNAHNNGVTDRLRFVQGDMLAFGRQAQFDVVVSNPPYIASRDVEALQVEVRDYEPRVALDGGEDGLKLFRTLIHQAVWALRAQAWLFMEVGAGQAGAVVELLQQAEFVGVQTYRDLAGIERVVCGRNSAGIRAKV